MLTRRCKTRTTPVAKIRSWRSKAGPYALEEIKSTLGLPCRFLVVRTLPNGNQAILSRHYRRGAAVKALERLEKGA